ncbi:hypothetical protein BJ875DRAFT_385901 [Amylocarpus encephaloides]|uniref:HMG box domain-containing protein n=1 Tax=Amylocarpus encephaloides TaxID=45428 RepID=A0A9P7YBK9_9HELO|nr:hypothetical protein BJ875DRAFT_385901 [Amylocarpus encephaloides]
MFTTVLNNQISTADRQQIEELWLRHLEMLKHGKIVYFLPDGVAKTIIEMGRTLQSIAEEIKAVVGTDIYIHFDEEKQFYRIGQVIDQYDLLSTQTLALVYLAVSQPLQFPMPGAVSSTSTSSTSISMPQLFAPARVVLAAQRKSTPASAQARIPKQRNSWILYRQSKHHIVARQYPEKNTGEISTVISAMWKNETTNVKAFWRKKAEDEKASHLARYPGYRPIPRHSSSIQRRNKRTKHSFVFSHALIDLSTIQNPSPLNLEAPRHRLDGSAADIDFFNFNYPAEEMERYMEGFDTNTYERDYTEHHFDHADYLIPVPAFDFGCA